MENHTTNIITLVCELCNSLLETSGIEYTSSISRTFCKLMLGLIFKFTKDSRNENYDEDLIPHIRMKILLRTPSDEDSVTMNHFNDCLKNLDEFESNCSREIYSMLLCFYKLSKFNAKRLRSSQASSEQDKCRLYKDSSAFNDINWDIFSKEPEVLKVSPSTFNVNFGAGLLFQGNEDTKSPCADELFQVLHGKYQRWNFDLNRPVEILLQDEGFVTPGSEFFEHYSEASEISDNINSDTPSTESDDDLTYQIELRQSDRLTWEHLGNNHPPKEPPFVSECPESIIHLWNIWNSVRKTMTISPSLGPEKNFEELKTDIVYLLFGVASDSFCLDPVYKTFHLRNGLHLKTITPECLADFCNPFIECGSLFCALKNFVQERLKLQFGPVHEAFCGCIKGILQIHRYCLLNMNWDKIQTLSELELTMALFRKKLIFLADFCFLNTKEDFVGTNFPTRIQLLDYLYNNVTRIVIPEFQSLVFYFFENCCNTYLKIACEWIFNGCFSNPNNYEEFFIYIQRDLEICWDWRRIGYIRVKEKEIPNFLHKYYKDIFACGRSVNLLRIFSKKEIFEKILPTSYPLIKCCFNAEQLDAYTSTWKEFQKNFYKKYNWKVKMKDKLVKTYSVEFYKKIADIRKKWFDAYEETCNIKKCINPLKDSESSLPYSPLEISVPKSEMYSETSSQLINTTVISHSREKEISTSQVIVSTISHTTNTNSENLNHSLEKSHVEDFSKIETVNDGSGDAHPSISTSNDENIIPRKSKLTSNLPTSSLIHDGSGDAPMLKKSQTDLELNRRKSVASDYQDQLNMIINDANQGAVMLTSTPMSICARNRTKNMSSSLQDSSEVYLEPKNTQLTDCVKNKLKVMTSEYHQRLSMSNIEQPVKMEELKPRILNDYEKNKLKVMSSEYHIRLNTLADEEEFIEKKLSSKNKLREQEWHKPSEQQPLKPTCDKKETDVKSEISEEEQPLKPTSLDIETIKDINDTSPSSFDEQENKLSICESEITSPELSESIITVIENKVPEEMSFENYEKESKSDIQSTRTEKKNFCFGIDEYRKSVFKEPSLKTTDQILKSSDAVKTVDIASFSYFFAPSITIPLKIQTQLVNEAMLWIFIEQERYLEHLTTLRNFLLLRKPEFSLQLTNNIFELLDNSKETSSLLSSYNLGNILQRSLSASNVKKTFKFERNLSLEVEESIPDSLELTDLQILRYLSMNYNVNWPINVLITEPIIKKYSRIFRFLLQFQKALWTLKTDFREMKNLKLGKSIQFRQILLYRHNMLQNVRIIHAYIIREALERCWHELVQHFIHTEIDLDELYMSHLRYINKIIQRCFLCDESVFCHKAIVDMLSSVLKYHEALASGSWKNNIECNLLFHTNYSTIHSVYQEFSKNVNDIKITLKMLVYQKQKVYFEPLYLELVNYKKEESQF